MFVANVSFEGVSATCKAQELETAIAEACFRALPKRGLNVDYDAAKGIILVNGEKVGTIKVK